MTPSELKTQIETRDENSHFFTRKTMQFFGDTMRNYGVRKTVITTQYDANGEYTDQNGVQVECWELYRKRPVKHGNNGSAFFACDGFRQLFPVR
jgi:hypothetical protein